MSDLFAPCTRDDYRFLVDLLASDLNRTDDAGLRRRFERYADTESAEDRAALDAHLDRTLRYLGAHDVAYALREATGQAPGVSLETLIAEAARALGMHAPEHGSPRERCERVVETHTLRTWRALPRDEQQRLLEGLGVERQRALDFVRTASGVYAFPVLVGAFNALVVQGLVKTVIFGTISKVVGARISSLLFGQLLARMPWWAAWLGPASIALSAGWTALELGGPALRKTVPAVLYLGLVSLREGEGAAADTPAPLRLGAGLIETPAPSEATHEPASRPSLADVARPRTETAPANDASGLRGPFAVRASRAGAWFLLEDAAGRLALDAHLSSGFASFSWLVALDEGEAELVRRGGEAATDALYDAVQAEAHRVAALGPGAEAALREAPGRLGARRVTGDMQRAAFEAIRAYHEAQGTRPYGPDGTVSLDDLATDDAP